MTQAQSRQDTRELILDAAEELFAARGYQATTISRLAAEVGIKGPAIYKHFASKRRLFEEVLERVFAPFLALIAQPGGADWGQEAIVRQHLANPNASRIVQHATLSGGEDLALLVERWYRPFFRAVRELAATPGSGFTPVSVMAFHSTLLGYLTLAPLHQAIFDTDPLTDEAIAELLALQARLVATVRPNGT